MRRSACLSAVACAFSAPLQAADLSDTQRMIHALVKAKICAPGECCDSATPNEVGAPSFVRIDFERQRAYRTRKAQTPRLDRSSALPHVDKQLEDDQARKKMLKRLSPV